MDERLRSAPLGSKAPAYNGGHWVKVERGWKWHCGDTFTTPGGDWTGAILPPSPAPMEGRSNGK